LLAFEPKNPASGIGADGAGLQSKWKAVESHLPVTNRAS